MAEENKFPMTESGKKKLEQELIYITAEKQKDVLSRIKTARSFCDFNEDSEYDEALREQASVDERILVLKDMIYNAEIIRPRSDDQSVTLGKCVTFVELPSGSEESYTIVGLAESDPLNGMISDQSPLANSLLGHKVNDEVLVRLPDGQIKVKITDIN